MGTKTIGVLKSDSSEVISYYQSYTSLKYKDYETADELFKDYESGTVDLIIVPNIMYLDKTLKN